MSTIDLPSIRRLYKPDSGFVLIDADLDRADAHFVAWEADEANLKHIFQQGIDIHTENARFIYDTSHPSTDQRQKAKSVIHAANYGGKVQTLASTAGVSTVKMSDFLAGYWFKQFPGIPRWHRRIEQQLRLKRRVSNVWGFKRFYFDRIDGQLLPHALAWIGQSSTAVTINKAMLRVHRELPEVQLLLQVHDSLLMQVPQKLCPAIFPRIITTMQIVIPYRDPFVIPISLKYSDRSWGEMTKWQPEGMKDVA